jgi:hypothetical protein
MVGLLGPAVRSIQIGIEEQWIPRQVADLLSTPFKKARLFNDYNLGTYLIWALYGQDIPVFIDGRLHAIAGYPELWRELKEAKKLGAQGLDHWQTFQQKWNFTAAAVEDSHIQFVYHDQAFPVLDYYFNNNEWALVHKDERFALFVKRSAYPAALIASYELPRSPVPLLPWKELFAS